MFELVYTSKSTKPLTKDEVLKISEESKANNLENGVTGLLVYYNGEFIQYLEGDEDYLRTLYTTRIAKDSRHTDVELIIMRQKESRDFPQWAMASYVIDASEDYSIKERIFRDNLISFSQLLEKDTLAKHLFCQQIKLLFEKAINRLR